MVRNECKDESQVEYLDKVNNERLETSRKRVAHAIRILKPASWSKCNSTKKKQTLMHDIAHATNLLEAAAEEMEFHCEWFDYDSGVVIQINDACSDLGQALAEMLEDEHDIELAICDVNDALVILAKALATLVRWNDEEADVSEV